MKEILHIVPSIAFEVVVFNVLMAVGMKLPFSLLVFVLMLHVVCEFPGGGFTLFGERARPARKPLCPASAAVSTHLEKFGNSLKPFLPGQYSQILKTNFLELTH